ncbi:MAG TPA: hypothetical protein ENI82_05460 [Bacteroidetes bacterium]|nr:hypothetical protein [Bacteroidota bacterium]
MKLFADLDITPPSHSTIILWSKKFGLYHIERKIEKSDDWIIMLDESIEFGNDKMLAVLGIKEKDVDFDKALQYKDLECLALKISSSWKGVEIKEVLDEVKSKVGQTKYAIADMGNAIKKSLDISQISHVEDLTHKLSWIIKNIYEKNVEFISYTKQLAHLRKTLALSKMSHILPPTQRVHSRFMNLKPIVDWGLAIIKIYHDRTLLPKEYAEKLRGILKYKELLLELSIIVEQAILIQKILKNKSVSENTIREFEQNLNKLPNKPNINIFKSEVLLYLNKLRNIKNEKNSKKILCSSDILESSFGKYKSYINNNKSIGITALALTIPAFLNDYSDKNIVLSAMESIKTKDVKQWRDNNIGDSLITRRKEILRKVG